MVQVGKLGNGDDRRHRLDGVPAAKRVKTEGVRSEVPIQSSSDSPPPLGSERIGLPVGDFFLTREIFKEVMDAFDTIPEHLESLIKIERTWKYESINVENSPENRSYINNLLRWAEEGIIEKYAVSKFEDLLSEHVKDEETRTIAAKNIYGLLFSNFLDVIKKDPKYQGLKDLIRTKIVSE